MGCSRCVGCCVELCWDWARSRAVSVPRVLGGEADAWTERRVTVLQGPWRCPRCWSCSPRGQSGHLYLDRWRSGGHAGVWQPCARRPPRTETNTQSPGRWTDRAGIICVQPHTLSKERRGGTEPGQARPYGRDAGARVRRGVRNTGRCGWLSVWDNMGPCRGWSHLALELGWGAAPDVVQTLGWALNNKLCPDG